MLNFRKGDTVKYVGGTNTVYVVTDVDHYEKKMTLSGMMSRVDVGSYILVTPTWAVGDTAIPDTSKLPDVVEQPFIVGDIFGSLLYERSRPASWTKTNCKRLAIAEPPAITVNVEVRDDSNLKAVMADQMRGHRHPIETVKRIRNGAVQIGSSVVGVKAPKQTGDKVTLELSCNNRATSWGVFTADELRQLATLCNDMADVMDA